MDALQGAIDVDTNIFFSINRMHNMYFDYFMSAYSGKWVWIPMYAAIWYVMLRNFHWKVTLFCMIGLALTITFADQACATWIRPYVERMRPSNLNNYPVGGHWRRFPKEAFLCPSSFVPFRSFLVFHRSSLSPGYR